MKHFLYIFFIPVCLSVFFSSCKKNEAIDLNPNINASNDVILTSSVLEYNIRMLVRARCDSVIMSGTSSDIDNATVTWDPASKTFTFAYGHVMGADSIIRIGIVRVSCSNGDRVPKLF